MHLPPALPELWVTESPLGEPEQLLILKKYPRVPRQNFLGATEAGKRQNLPLLLPLMLEVPGQPSRNCGPAPHLISGHQAGWTQQAASVLKMLCVTGPAPTHPVCVTSARAGCCRSKPWGFMPHPHRIGKPVLLVSGGHRTDALLDHSRQKSSLLHSLAITADFPLSLLLSTLKPHQRLTRPSDILYPFVPHPHPFVWYLQRESDVGGNLWRSPGWAGAKA